MIGNDVPPVVSATGKVYDGVRVIALEDDAFVAPGHVEPGRMAAAALKAFAEVDGDPDVDTITADDVQHVWASLSPAYRGAPDDEWVMRWRPARGPAADGEFPVTVVEP